MLERIPQSLFLRRCLSRPSLITLSVASSTEAVSKTEHSATDDGTTTNSMNGDATATSHSPAMDKNEIKRTAATTTTDNVDYVGKEDFSLGSLHRRMESFVAQYCYDRLRLAVTIAGGGGHFLSTLSATAGASNVLLEGQVTYDRESYRQLVQRNLHPEAFKYCSALSADYGAEAALHRAVRLGAAADPAFGHEPVDSMRNAVAIACSSALQSSTSRSRKNRGSRAFITVMRSCADEREKESPTRMVVHLAAPTGDATTDRSRFDEDIFVSHCMLTCLNQALDFALVDDRHGDPPAGGGTVKHTTATGDTMVTHLPPCRARPAEKGPTCNSTVASKTISRQETILYRAAQRILSGQDEVVALLPNTKDGNDDVYSLECLSTKLYLPPHSVVFPGSFNPPHAGHVALAQAALEASDSWNAWFELSVTNADKPPLQASHVVERCMGFLHLLHQAHEDTVVFPKHWGILLTAAPLFVQKVNLLHPLQVSRSYSTPGAPTDNTTMQQPPLHFCVGTDTLVRLLDSKYYDHSQEQMLQAISDMPCQFVVGGRLEQRKSVASGGAVAAGVPPQFVTGKEQVDALPKELHSKFVLMPAFRFDVSSTELRKKQKEKQEHS